MRTHPETIRTHGVLYKRSCRELCYPEGRRRRRRRRNFRWDWVRTMGTSIFCSLKVHRLMTQIKRRTVLLFHCAKNRIYAIVYFAYISSIRMNIRVRIREVSHWYILRIEPISHCVYFEYPQIHHVRLWRILELTSPDTTSLYLVPTWIVYCIGYTIRLCTLYTSLITYKFLNQ